MTEPRWKKLDFYVTTVEPMAREGEKVTILGATYFEVKDGALRFMEILDVGPSREAVAIPKERVVAEFPKGKWHRVTSLVSDDELE